MTSIKKYYSIFKRMLNLTLNELIQLVVLVGVLMLLLYNFTGRP
ncbi:MAG: hypothetical protein O3B93_05025 [Proteobacteria bacterium]|nr:hypothetical protein [Pseudomonadota bacterium]